MFNCLSFSQILELLATIMYLLADPAKHKSHVTIDTRAKTNVSIKNQLPNLGSDLL